MEHGSTTGGDGLTTSWLVKGSLVLGALGLALACLVFMLGDEAEPVCGTSPFPYGSVAGIATIAAWLAITAGFVLALLSIWAKGAHHFVPLAIVWLAADAFGLVAVMNALAQRWMSWCGG
jgi:hypothetical protein